MKILILIFFFKIKESKMTRGHNYTLVWRNKVDWMLERIHFRRGPSSTDCVHASSVNMFKNKIDKYLVKVGYT